MSIIHELSPEVVSLIAAGEIIERPAFALKELIENAIDANAGQISISLTHNGLTQMIVEDDGKGMDSQDVLLSWKLHTTSKLHTPDELHSIHTQGFRGEALASIAATGTLTIQSRQKNSQLGYEIVIRKQKRVKEGKIGMPVGTRMIVENLFESLPARQKFLQSPQTELRHCIEVVTTYAISHPGIRFILKHNGHILIQVSTTTDPLERLTALFDQDLVDSLLPVNYQESYVTLQGFISHPSKATSSSSKQFIFLNHRPIKDSLISGSIKEAMRELLPQNKNSVFFLNFTIPNELIDVNVHPRKEIVRFASPTTVYSAVQSAIQEMLLSNSLTFQSTLQNNQTTAKITDSLAGAFLKEIKKNGEIELFKKIVCTQIHNTYIVFETKTGFMFVDQHAAQERTLYEQLKIKFQAEQKKNKTVQIRAALSLSKAEILLVDEYEAVFKTFGFTFEKKKNKNKEKMYLISVPALFSDRDPIPIFEEILSDVENGIAIRTTDTLTHQMLTYIACHQSVKAGDVLTQKQMQGIVHELQKVPNKFTCPHGRPTMIEIPLHDLHKRFQRI
ncbi:MAG: DNA mismatch repair endonuclease MutL [Candidatus Woesebacteria bacterium]